MSKKEKVMTDAEKNLSPLSNEMSTQVAKLKANQLASKHYNIISPSIKKDGSNRNK